MEASREVLEVVAAAAVDPTDRCRHGRPQRRAARRLRGDRDPSRDQRSRKACYTSVLQQVVGWSPLGYDAHLLAPPPLGVPVACSSEWLDRVCRHFFVLACVQ